ncbi:OB-fold domain-containing protein [Blastomonas sp.]|uniref:Zn-ribbon domain-containing OB-fold protein n=1 Tax=Blastomonas sp. TaxID=1909299 RepID=UPI00262B8BF1|nr:OB-fold domain-containing protein [Blastomonas sp.]MDM7956653.1 OB-fold domain-containing protein [Blastomonas sp.]
MNTHAPRPLPALTSDTMPFWTAGAHGQLLIQQCCLCSYFIHPPTGFCPECENSETVYTAVSGRGFVETFTVNYKIWMPGLPDRYVLALVRLAEQNDVRLATNIVGCDPASVRFDMPVKVQFEQTGDLWIPLFAPDPVP